MHDALDGGGNQEISAHDALELSLVEYTLRSGELPSSRRHRAASYQLKPHPECRSRRSPELAGHVIVHEPPFLQVLPDAAELGRTFQAQVEQALATRGARGAMELFIRQNAGSDVFDRLDPILRERMIANGPSFFGHELAMFMSRIPSETELAGLRVPVRTLAGRDHRGHYYYRAAEWLAKALGGDLVEIPGAHAPYLARPREFAAALLALLKGELERAIRARCGGVLLI